MSETIQPRWLAWGREIQALSQTGLHYAQDDYQRGRYRRLIEIAAEMIAAQSNLEPGDLVRFFTAQVGYATPKVDVRGAVFRQGKLLLVRERTDGGWSMPGGWADVGDVPSEAAEREVWEEAGCRVAARKLIGVYDANRSGPLELFHAFKIIFLCEYLEGEPGASAETSEAAFFGHGEIPAQLSGERTRPRHILDAFAAQADPSLHSVFD